MKSTASELEKIISRRLHDLKEIPEAEFALKPSPVKWSKKEILGHLIDSAESNIRRFVIAQYEESPAIVYNQDKWVAIVNYQQWKTSDIINLWFSLNKQVCEILKNTSPEMAQKKCQTQELHTIEWLAKDYLKHLKHHLHVVLNLEPVIYP
jgi:hypothetical protein